MPPKPAITTPCKLKPKNGQTNRFESDPGTLTLTVKEIVGTTNLDTVNSRVLDISNIKSPVPVDHKASPSDLNFNVQAGKTYLVLLMLVQITSPYESRAQIVESPCGQAVGAPIDVTNLAPGYVVYA